jgi:hypothetical protein
VPPKEPLLQLLLQLLLRHRATLHPDAMVCSSEPYLPWFSKLRHHDVSDLTSQELTPAFLASQDCLLIANEHSRFDSNQMMGCGPPLIHTATRGEPFAWAANGYARRDCPSDC